MSKKVRRLFEGFEPKHYQLFVDPNRDTMIVRGKVTVTGQKKGRPTQRITLHQSGLKITNATIIRHDKKGNEEFAVVRINHQAKFEEVRLHTDAMLYAGQYTVTLTYEGVVSRAMEGVYPCFFKHDGQDKQLIATQFESHFARQVFPCIDEPEAKATFDLTLVSPEGETALSNTPIKTQNVKDGKLETTFETTPHMSTYLLAFIYGELGYKEATTKNGVAIRTYATPDNVAFTDFALECAVRCLEFYEDYFDIPYPLEKCDLIALPDFASGAMENWGCITFREHALLVDPANTSLPSKQYVAMVVAHELAHQWFGNLVTMEWWNDLWLNEGFANWMEYFATDALFPEWNLLTQYIVDEQQLAFKLDALEHTHPIQVTINHPDEIRTIFDTISYSKGGSSIMMLARYLGDNAFRDGLRHYLKTHAYKNTSTTDLWDAFEKVSTKPVGEFMDSWTSQPGFPIVRAAIKDGSLTASQHRFLLNPRSNEEGKNTQLWPIPLLTNITLPEDTLTKETCMTTVPMAKEPFLLNHERSGFYRVVYDSIHVTRLAKAVEDKKLSPIDRLGLLSDALESAKAGYMSTTDALTLLGAFNDEDNSAVWDVMAGGLGTIRVVMDDEELRESLKPYIRGLVAKQLKRLGWEPTDGESHFDKLLRPTILGLAAVSDETEVVEKCLKLFKDMQKPEDIHPDVRGIVYSTAARLGNAATFDKLLSMYKETSSSEEHLSLSSAITNFKQPELIARALAEIRTDTVRLQDIMYWVAYSFGNRHARSATWDWLVENWSWLKENLGNDLAFSRMPVYAARVCSNQEFLEVYKSFFEKVMEPSLERSYKQGVEIIEWQSAWRARDLDAIRKFFAA